MSEENRQWVKSQQKTFTKWVNNHLSKAQCPLVEDAETDFDTGIVLMNLVHALYPKVPLPKRFNPHPRMRVHKLDNLSLALDMLEQARVKTNFLGVDDLVDHNLKMILGMMWAIILDYAIKGISVDEHTAKEGLLLWCRKKTKGYAGIDPPGLNNFSGDWKSGLAFCALIHRHRPDLLDYAQLSSHTAEENLERAFSVAEQSLGIPRLLDAEDLLQVPKPDERSVMTYVSEFFHRFASQDMKEHSARRVHQFLLFAQEMRETQREYERRAEQFSRWCALQTERFGSREFGESCEAAVEIVTGYRTFILEELPMEMAEKLDIESLYAEIQTRLRVNNRPAYVPPEQYSPAALQQIAGELSLASRDYAIAARDHRFQFVTKESYELSEDDAKEMKVSFNHFDSDKSGALSPVEFKAACSALGVPFRNADHFRKTFASFSGNGSTITREEYYRFVQRRKAHADEPEDLLEAFKSLADNGEVISVQQLLVPPITEETVDILVQEGVLCLNEKGDIEYSSLVSFNFGGDDGVAGVQVEVEDEIEEDDTNEQVVVEDAAIPQEEVEAAENVPEQEYENHSEQVEEDDPNDQVVVAEGAAIPQDEVEDTENGPEQEYDNISDQVEDEPVEEEEDTFNEQVEEADEQQVSEQEPEASDEEEQDQDEEENQ